MSERLEALIEEAEQVIAHPDDERFRPVLLLELLVELAKQAWPRGAHERTH